MGTIPANAKMFGYCSIRCILLLRIFWVPFHLRIYLGTIPTKTFWVQFHLGHFGPAPATRKIGKARLSRQIGLQLDINNLVGKQNVSSWPLAIQSHPHPRKHSVIGFVGDASIRRYSTLGVTSILVSFLSTSLHHPHIL